MMQTKDERGNTDGLWSIGDVAEYLGISDRSVRRRMKYDDLPHRWIGGKLRFRREDLDEWIDQQPGKAA